MGQWRNEGSLCAHPYDDRRAILAESVVEYEGVMSHIAHDLGYHRSHIYRLVKEHRLWGIVNRIRKRRLEREARERNKDY